MTLAARLRILFAFIIGFQALLIGYLPLYFSDLGFSPLQIAFLAGTENLAMLIGPPLLAARHFPRGLSITILSAVSAIVLLPAIGNHLFWPVLGFLFLSLLFNRAAFAVVNEYAIRSELEGKARFSEVRSWGSASFIIGIYVLGRYADSHGVGQILAICCAALFCQALAGLLLLDHVGRAHISNIRGFFKLHVDRPMVILYLAMIGLWASHAPVYTYLSIHLRHSGWDTSTISWAWNICVISEIIVFVMFSKLERFLSLRSIILLSIAAACVRWTALSMFTGVPIILAAQVLHGFTYGASFIASQKLVSLRVVPEARKMAQAMLMAASSGLGSLLGKVLAGAQASLLGITGDFSTTFASGAVVALLAVVVWTAYPKLEPQPV